MSKITIGWLEDDIGYVGGAELSSGILRRNAPRWARVLYCPPDRRPPTDKIDLFVIQNCVTYDSRWLQELALKPVVKQVRDPWFAGSSLLRRWLLENSELLIFSSPMQADKFEYPSNLAVKLVPPPVNLDAFRAASLPSGQRAGNVFVGRVDIFKGAHAAIDWAIRENQPLDLYGLRFSGGQPFVRFGQLPDNIRFHNEVPYEQMPGILGRAKRFVFFPSWPEAFGRVVVEAWAAGCELLLRDENIGSCWWIANHPEALVAGVEMFWDTIKEVIL